jgi:hypothetical protein
MSDLTQVYAQRALAPRMRGGRIVIEKSPQGSVTILHAHRNDWNGGAVKTPIAQLRVRGQKLQLYWQRANGRWIAYQDDARRPFLGSLQACLMEIHRDPLGCFWG